MAFWFAVAHQTASHGPSLSRPILVPHGIGHRGPVLSDGELSATNVGAAARPRSKIHMRRSGLMLPGPGDRPRAGLRPQQRHACRHCLRSACQHSSGASRGGIVRSSRPHPISDLAPHSRRSAIVCGNWLSTRASKPRPGFRLRRSAEPCKL